MKYCKCDAYWLLASSHIYNWGHLRKLKYKEKIIRAKKDTPYFVVKA